MQQNVSIAAVLRRHAEHGKLQAFFAVVEANCCRPNQRLSAAQASALLDLARLVV